MTRVELRRVGESADIDAFIAAAKRAQGGDPHWIAPLRMQLRDILDPEKSPFLQQNDAAAWVAFIAGKPVGRIFATRNEAHLRRYDDATGHFGFLEAIDDTGVFDALIGAAAEWLAQKGLSRMLGPLSPSLHYEVGVLVDGFDTPPMVGINHAPPHYAQHLQRLGFAPAMDFYAIVWDEETLRSAVDYVAALWRKLAGDPDPLAGVPARPDPKHWEAQVRRIIERWPDDAGIELRTLDRRHYHRDMQLVTDIYNDAWAANWGDIPIQEAEARFIADMMRPIIRPDWVTFAYWQGEPIGLFLLVPNLNEAIADLDGRLLPFGWARLLWRLHVRGVNSARLAMAGIRRAHLSSRTGTMAAVLLLADAIDKAAKAGMRQVEASWILANNRRMLNLVNTIEGRRAKTFQVFGRACRP
jgi:hypothetical protein